MKTHTKYTDHDVVHGLQARDRVVEEWFYRTMKKYFMTHFNEEFFDHDAKEEIFQDSFIKLWTEITDHTVTVRDGRLYRRQRDGNVRPLTCVLTTFLMAIARNEYREKVRDDRLMFVPEYYNDTLSDGEVADGWMDEDSSERRERITAECLQSMSPSCLEILTLFYVEGQSLDEIMLSRQGQNTSKEGLKTRKYKCMNALREKITNALSV